MPDAPKVTMADVLGKSVPALSSTNDMPAAEVVARPAPLLSVQGGTEKQPEYPGAIDATPAPKPEPTKAGTTEVPAPTGSPEPTKKPDETVASTEEPDDAKAAKAKKGINERFSELTAQRKAAEDLADGAIKSLNDKTAELTAAMAKLGEVRAPDAPDPRPVREGFETPDAFETALVEWAGRTEAKRVQVEFETKAATERAAETAKTEEQKTADARKAQEAETARVAADYAARVAKAKEARPDFDEVAYRDDVQISIPMSHAIINAPDGPDIAYHLGQHPEEAARIAALTNPVMVVYEMGKISAQLAEAAKPKPSNTPPPPKPLSARGGADVDKPLGELSMDEYASRRQREMKEQRSARH